MQAQVSFGVHKSEQDAARQYDRALIIVKGRLAKTNFPMTDYEAEVKTFEAYLLSRRVLCTTSSTARQTEPWRVIHLVQDY